MPHDSDLPTSIGHALLLWVLYAFVFVFFGGVGAGLTALLWLAVMPEPFSDVLYAVIFAAYGFIAYRLVQHLVRQRGRSGAEKR